jgi:hypothetical protein
MPQVSHTDREVFSDLPDGLPFDLAVVVDTILETLYLPFLSSSDLISGRGKNLLDSAHDSLWCDSDRRAVAFL